MDDRELLEMAAKAAGVLYIEMDDGSPDFSEDRGHIYGIRQLPFGVVWNPLADDGDALRLAASLRMTIDIGLWREEVQVRAYDKNLGGMYHIDEQGDLITAARRAITRAAAEISKAMP